MAPKVYGIHGFTSVGRVITTLLAKGVEDVGLVPVNVMTGDQMRPDFVKLGLDVFHIPYTHYYLVNVAKKAEPITSRKHVNAWWEDISSRTSWKKVLELASASH